MIMSRTNIEWKKKMKNRLVYYLQGNVKNVWTTKYENRSSNYRDYLDRTSECLRTYILV